MSLYHISYGMAIKVIQNLLMEEEVEEANFLKIASEVNQVDSKQTSTDEDCEVSKLT